MRRPGRIAFWPAAIWHLIVTMWRHQTGRWFVFRDRPKWFVVAMASEDRKKYEPESDPVTEADLNAFAKEARAELRTRHRKER